MSNEYTTENQHEKQYDTKQPIFFTFCEEVHNI